MYDLKIINGDVLDGTGSNALSINIAIKDGVIVLLIYTHIMTVKSVGMKRFSLPSITA